MKLVEHVGSGIKRISEALAEDGLLPPVLDIDDNWFSISFIRRAEMVSPKSAQKSAQKSAPKSAQKSAQKICELMRDRADITINELTSEIGISNRSIKNHIATLQKEGKIKRIGPDKGGKWEVLK